MGSGWVVGGVALLAALVVVATARLRCRALRLQLADQTRRHDVAVARLRGELSASVADAARARAEVDTVRAALSSALLESGRLQQRLAEVRAAMVDRAEHDAVVAGRDALQAERDGYARELRTLAPVVEELAAHRGYVESLQRELLYRDEQLLALDDAGGPLAVGSGHPPGPAPTNGHAVPHGPDDVIDLTDGNGSGQRREPGVAEPGVEQVVERPARNR